MVKKEQKREKEKKKGKGAKRGEKRGKVRRKREKVTSLALVFMGKKANKEWEPKKEKGEYIFSTYTKYNFKKLKI